MICLAGGEALGNSNLFGNLESDGITIDSAAKEFNVSTATVRNWIKTGYLKVSKKNVIALESLEEFKSEVVGKEKLTKRANKSQYDHHNHVTVGEDLTQSIGSFSGIPLDEISDAYENSLSNSFRNKEGIYYTPSKITESFFSSIDFDVSKCLFLDPCCGSGNFMLEAIRFGFAPENIYGIDIDPLAIEIARRRTSALVGEGKVKIYNADFLKDIPKEVKDNNYDVIFTNPPWGKKIARDEKEKIAREIGVHKATDTSGLFLISCLSLVKEAGIIGMLMPDAFFNVASFLSVRERILELDILSMTDYGKPFKGILSGAKGIVFKNEIKAGSDIICNSNKETFVRARSTFSSNPKKIFNFNCNTKEAEAVKYVMEKSHLTLAGNADWGIGIVTGNNAKFSKPSWQPGHIAAYKGSDVYNKKLEQPSVYIPGDMSLYQQVAPERLYLAEEKLIYRFISSKLIFYHDKDQSYVLNSANIMIPHNGFPIGMNMLADYLSSDFVNWIFKSIFSTHKVLRADIESIPIFVDILGGMMVFDEDLLLSKLGLERVNGSYFIK